jgi:large subunit ribosomal protein L9
MKVILLKDVSGLGRRFDIKTVADGYAVNFLIPRGLAKIATKDEEKSAEALRAKEGERRHMADATLIAALEAMSGEPLAIPGKANEQGHLFASIKREDIAEHLSKRIALPIDTDAVKLSEPIKEIGEHEAEIAVGKTSKKVVVQVTAA